MDEKEISERAKVVEVAKSWLTTPYHHMGRVKGAGVDCLTLLAEVFHEAGLVERVPVEFYPKDWHLHRNSERYVQGLLRYTREIKGPPQPADIVVWKIGRCFAHGAIVINWPQVINAWDGIGCCYEDAEKASYLQQVGENTSGRGAERPRRFFSFWGK